MPQIQAISNAEETAVIKATLKEMAVKDLDVQEAMNDGRKSTARARRPCDPGSSRGASLDGWQTSYGDAEEIMLEH